MITTKTATRAVTTAANGRLIPVDRLRETTGPDGSGRGTPAARIARGAMGARGCTGAPRGQGLVATGPGCPPGSSGNPGRAAAAAGHEVAAPGPEVVAVSGGIGVGGLSGARSSLPSGLGSKI